MLITRYRFEAGHIAQLYHEGPEENLLHPLVGTLEVDGVRVGGRKHVFDAFPGGLLGRGLGVVRAVTDCDFLLASHSEQEPLTLVQTTAKTHMIGSGTAHREVREILPKARHLRSGETINRPGGWSSWPPHAFDKEKVADFQEVFYVFTDPKDGYAVMRRNGELVELHSGDKVDVPLGEHPIVAGPGVRLFYAWFFVGADKLYPRWAEDMGSYA